MINTTPIGGERASVMVLMFICILNLGLLLGHLTKCSAKTTIYPNMMEPAPPLTIPPARDHYPHIYTM